MLGLRRRVDISSLSPHVLIVYIMPLAQGLSPPTCSWPKPLECSEELFEVSMAHTDSVRGLCYNRISDLGSSKKRFMAPWHCTRTVPNESGSGAARGLRIHSSGCMRRERQLSDDLSSLYSEVEDRIDEMRQQLVGMQQEILQLRAAAAAAPPHATVAHAGPPASDIARE